ncbi:MAG: hypothetical protein WCF06_05575 [Nitrososphaeraceae archaeon]
MYETAADAVGFTATYAVLYGMMALVAADTVTKKVDKTTASTN